MREGVASFIQEGQCVWARLSGRDLDQSATFQTLGFDERSFEVAGGVQGALGDVWRVGWPALTSAAISIPPQMHRAMPTACMAVRC